MAWWLLPVVEKPGFAVTHVDAEIAFMRDKQNAWTIMDVAVVMNVDQKVIVQYLFPYPFMKDRDEVSKRNRRRVVDKKFDPQSV